MKLRLLRVVSKLVLTVDDVARALAIRPASAAVFCHRAVKTGELMRLQRNRYMLRERWEHLSREERWHVANLLQVPSYISLTTALAYHELTTQVQPAYVESIAVSRSQVIEIGGTVFRYVKIAPALYFGFLKREGIFVATPEKALADCLYLSSLHRYHLDWSSLETSRIHVAALRRLLRRYPRRTQHWWAQRWKA